MEIISYPRTSNEQKIAALAHTSILLTFIVGVTTGGIGVLLTMLVPLFIWFKYKDRSSYISFHALQATLFQLETIALMLVLSVIFGVILAVVWLVTGLLSFVLVGLLLVPVAIIISIILGGILAIIPLASLTYGLIGAWQVYNDDNFRYYGIGNWLEDRLDE